MKILPTFEEFLNENSFNILNKFFEELLKEFKLKASKTEAILMDVTGNKNETVFLNLEELLKETNLEEESLFDSLMKVYNKYKTQISKKDKDDGYLSFTYIVKKKNESLTENEEIMWYEKDPFYIKYKKEIEKSRTFKR